MGIVALWGGWIAQWLRPEAILRGGVGGVTPPQIRNSSVILNMVGKFLERR